VANTRSSTTPSPNSRRRSTRIAAAQGR